MKTRVAFLFALFALVSCQRAYFAAVEKLGYHKRDLFVSRVTSARDAQEDAKEEFASALDRFRSVVNVKGGDLEAKYDELNSVLQSSEAKAKQVRARIKSVEDVSEALFDEWEDELSQYSNQSLRNSSERKLRETRRRYDSLHAAMIRAEKTMDPVLQPLRDNVLFLKHNLNAKAIASLEGELAGVQDDVTRLIREMDSAIREADEMIAHLQSGEGEG